MRKFNPLQLLICSIYIFCLTLPLSGQYHFSKANSPYGTQLGFSVKATLEAGRKATPFINFRLSATAGVASDFIGPWIYPSFHTEFQLYNGGLGSGNDRLTKGFLLDIIAAVTVTTGVNNQLASGKSSIYTERNVPLYYFSNFALPALQNPFDHSLSVGTNFIVSTDRQKSFQRIGFVNLHAWRLQLSYYNDGGFPFSDIFLGDRRDRYYTGGGTLSYNGKRHTLLETVELGYHKFTGYTRGAFEVSNKLNLAYVNYRNKEQHKYNRSLWVLNLANPSRGFGINLRTYNYIDQDIQHKIHWGLSDAYHISPYPAYWGINASYYYSGTKFGIR